MTHPQSMIEQHGAAQIRWEAPPEPKSESYILIKVWYLNHLIRVKLFHFETLRDLMTKVSLNLTSKSMIVVELF